MQELTDWFDCHVEPREIGVYFREGYGNTDGYQFWDGKNWLYGGSIKDAARHDKGRCVVPHRWRGLAYDPNARPVYMTQDEHHFIQSIMDAWVDLMQPVSSPHYDTASTILAKKVTRRRLQAMRSLFDFPTKDQA